MPMLDGEFYKKNNREDDNYSIIFVRFGELPDSGRSKNYLTGELELGVSCYMALCKGSLVRVILPSVNTKGLVSLSGVNNRPAYEVVGDVIGVGSDGEPLLHPCHIIRPIILN